MQRVNNILANNKGMITSGAVYESIHNLHLFYKNYGTVSISSGVTYFDIPEELENKNICGILGCIGSYIIPRPHLNNAGQYAQNWGIALSFTGGKLNFISPDTWSGVLQIVFIYNN